jgi:putative ABC transport system permease protein
VTPPSAEATEGKPANRLFALLLRAYPEHARARFADGMRHALGRDLEAARAGGVRAVAMFWIFTSFELCRFGLAERREGLVMRGMFTVDWRDAWRSLRATPMVTAFAVVSLALGIGGVTALFSILNSLALKPLPVRDPASLAILDELSWTHPVWEAVKTRKETFAADAFGWATPRFNLSSTAAADMAEGLYASGEMFEMLGVPAVLGRTFSERDDVRGGGPDGPVAVISYAMWQRRYGGAPDAIGRTIAIERVPFTIIGVAPKGFFGPDVGRAFDVAVPLASEPLIRPEDSSLDQRSHWWMNIMVRLKPGQTAEQATALLRAMQPQIRQETLPPGRAEDIHEGYLTDPFKIAPAPGGRSPWRVRYEKPLTAILVVVGLVLLIACANVANLLLARASARRYELTLRLALGASRWRIARQLLVESLWLAAAGAALGIWLARWGSRMLVAQLSSTSAPINLDLALDWRVLGFTIAVSVAAALLFGVAPALSVSRLTANEVLKEQGRDGRLDRRAGLRHASLVLQVALSLALVVAAGLFTRTFVALDTRDLGFNRHGVLLVTANVQRNPARGEAQLALLTRLEQAARAVPGVSGAALSMTTPGARSGRNTRVVVPPDSPLSPRQRASWVNLVAPGWFATMGLQLTGGRDFNAHDKAGAPLVAVVNRAFVARFLQGTSPIGAQVSTEEPGPGSDPVFQIVGVVEDTIYRSLRAPMEPTMYLPYAQEKSSPVVTIAVRAASGPPEHLVRSVAAAIEREDPTALLSFRTMNDQIAAALTQERLMATLAGFFGILGLLLAAVGLYGVTSYAVTSRRAEIGIRMALGSSAGGVVTMVLRRVAWLVAIGIVLGGALSVWAARFINTLLYGLDARDPSTFAGAAALLMLVAALAAWLPARRASRIDPMRVLRNS